MAGYLVDDTRKVTTHRLFEMKQGGKKIAMLTSYDYTMAQIVDGAGVDVILVGDSASNTMAGNLTTLPITLDQMIYHARSEIRYTLAYRCMVFDRRSSEEIISDQNSYDSDKERSNGQKKKDLGPQGYPADCTLTQSYPDIFRQWSLLPAVVSELLLYLIRQYRDHGIYDSDTYELINYIDRIVGNELGSEHRHTEAVI